MINYHGSFFDPMQGNDPATAAPQGEQSAPAPSGMPPPHPPQPPVPYRSLPDRDAETAKTLTIVGMVLQLLFLLLGILVPYFLIGVLWLLLDYFLIYKKIVDGQLNEAETPSLILGILQLVLGGVLPGVFILIAHVKIKDSLRNRAPVYAPQPPT